MTMILKTAYSVLFLSLIALIPVEAGDFARSADFAACDRCSSAIDHTAQDRGMPSESMDPGENAIHWTLLSLTRPAPVPRDTYTLPVRGATGASYAPRARSRYPTPCSRPASARPIRYMPLRI
jgi:hypothetical protein